MTLMTKFLTQYNKQLYEEWVQELTNIQWPCTTNPIKPFGLSTAKLLIIKDPGDYNQECALELENKSDINRVLYKKFKDSGFNMDSILWVNSLPYTPKVKVGDEFINRPPNQKEQFVARHVLNNLIKIIDPVFIITCGNITLNMFKNESILDCHGKPFEVFNYRFYPIYSVDYLLSLKDNELLFKDMQSVFNEDLNAIITSLKDKHPELLER